MKQEQKISRFFLVATSIFFAASFFFTAQSVFADTVLKKPDISDIFVCQKTDLSICDHRTAKAGEVLKIVGGGITQTGYETKALFNGTPLQILSSDSTENYLVVPIPTDFKGGSVNVVVQVGNLKSNVFPISVIGSGAAGSSGEDCNPLIEECEDPATGGTGNGGGTNNDGGSSSPGGLIGEGLGKISDRFDTGGKITGAKSVGELIGNIIDILLGLVLTIAILFLIIGGFFYITSAGDPDKAKKGKQTLTYAVLGIALVMLSYTIVYVINSALSQ